MESSISSTPARGFDMNTGANDKTSDAAIRLNSRLTTSRALLSFFFFLVLSLGLLSLDCSASLCFFTRLTEGPACSDAASASVGGCFRFLLDECFNVVVVVVVAAAMAGVGMDEILRRPGP